MPLSAGDDRLMPLAPPPLLVKSPSDTSSLSGLRSKSEPRFCVSVGLSSKSLLGGFGTGVLGNGVLGGGVLGGGVLGCALVTLRSSDSSKGDRAVGSGCALVLGLILLRGFLLLAASSALRSSSSRSISIVDEPAASTSPDEGGRSGSSSMRMSLSEPE